MATQVDWFKLAVALNLACDDRGLSLRAAAREMDIPVSGLSKLRHGGRLSANAVARLIVWLWPGDPVPTWIEVVS